MRLGVGLAGGRSRRRGGRDEGLLTKAIIEDDQPPTYPSQRVGCNVGAGFIIAEINELTAALDTARDDAGGFSHAAWGERGMNNLTPLWMPKYLPNMLACHATILSLIHL